jgi:hypothetical protein
LPFDHPLRSGRNYRGARHSLVLGEELTRSLKDRSRDEGATLYMALLRAWPHCFTATPDSLTS